MLEYIKKIKRQFRDTYNFIPIGGTQEEPLFDNIPNGEYPMTIDNKKDYVTVTNGKMSCCNFKDENK